MKTPQELADLILNRANDGYHNQEKSGYPPYAIAPWDDRIRWSAYLKKVIAVVLSEEFKLKKKKAA